MPDRILRPEPEFPLEGLTELLSELEARFKYWHTTDLSDPGKVLEITMHLDIKLEKPEGRALSMTRTLEVKPTPPVHPDAPRHMEGCLCPDHHPDRVPFCKTCDGTQLVETPGIQLHFTPCPDCSVPRFLWEPRAIRRKVQEPSVLEPLGPEALERVPLPSQAEMEQAAEQGRKNLEAHRKAPKRVK